jgi:hypothetical protein
VCVVCAQVRERSFHDFGGPGVGIAEQVAIDCQRGLWGEPRPQAPTYGQQVRARGGPGFRLALRSFVVFARSSRALAMFAAIRRA